MVNLCVAVVMFLELPYCFLRSLTSVHTIEKARYPIGQEN
jgi:hypothetical protein